MAVRITPAQIHAKLHDIIHDMADHAEQFVRQPGIDFTRKRICTFENTVLNILTMESHSLNRELFEYYRLQGQLPPTKSAFVQSRQKLTVDAFPYLLKQFNSKFPFHNTYKGLHLLACDGTDLNIPADDEDKASFISYNSKNGGYYQDHTIVMYDLLGKRYTDAVIQPRGEMKEVSACCQMVDRNPIDGKCLFLADRGFMSFNLMAHVMEKEQFFLIRVKNIDSEHSPFKHEKLPVSDECETFCEYILTRKRSKIHLDHPEKYKLLLSSRTFDFIDLKDTDSTYTLSFRLAKIKISDGVYEYLITNLPQNTFPVSELKALYKMRWEIETSFLFLKYGIALNYFHSILRDSIKQEIYARLILYNFISLILSCVSVPNIETVHTYQVSVSDAIYKCRLYLLKRMKNLTIIDLLLHDKSPVRPDRKFERNLRSQRLKSLQNRT